MDKLIALRESRAGVEAITENDMEFHRLLGRAACNKLTQRIYDFALDYLEHTIRETHKFQVNGASSHEVHTKILNAINNNDIELAREAIDHSVAVWRGYQES
jgi:GntR family transcriptional repressor for pyruvate dehydrogenase complex